MISPLTNEKKFGDVSNEDFTTLGLTVVQNSSDIATTSRSHDQIDGRTLRSCNSSHVDFADRCQEYHTNDAVVYQDRNRCSIGAERKCKPRTRYGDRLRVWTSYYRLPSTT